MSAGQQPGTPAASATPGAEAAIGWCSPDVAAELPDLRLLSCEVQVGRRGRLTGDSPPDVVAQLRSMSSRIRGARAIAMRREPVPAAYRVFYLQIGMDPDVQRTPIEAAVLERMLRGGFPTAGLLEDVLMIAMLDTGVAAWALAADTLDGPLGIRTSREGEPLGRAADAVPLPLGRLVIADASGPVAVLFGEVGEPHQPRDGTRSLVVFAVQVAGVPTLYVEESLWSARTSLEHP
ncbi:MAG TPA: hypothetical protein VHT27_00775 [Solirubrobacteraceae bacterium]|jgi:DNA/RNA-binding domain of Phe-tRNA-synthetase-like protein|nr:hypothetical protein [Solirubrobacteraceae bacterium]